MYKIGKLALKAYVGDGKMWAKNLPSVGIELGLPPFRSDAFLSELICQVLIEDL